jgi:transglutaminase-like putative cysteine protease
MNEARKTGNLWVVATLAIAMLPQISRMPLPVIIMAAAPMLWRVGAEVKGWKPAPNLIRYVFTALTLVTLFVSHNGLFGRRAAVNLLASMLALKLLECETVRDARLTVSFSFFLCATQFLFVQGVIMPIYGLATIMLGMVALAQLQRREAFEPLGRIPSMKITMFADLAFSLRLLLLAIPIGIAFFVFFPRWASPLWGVPDSTLDAKSGLSDSMSPGSIQNLFMDDSPALRAVFAGRIPEPSERYWRGPVFWKYDDNTWSSSFFGRNVDVESMPDPTGAVWRYTVQLEPNERNWLFALDYPTQLPKDTRLSMDFQLIRRQPVIQLLQYEMASDPNFVDTPKLKETMRSLALELPVNLNPRTRQLVNDWRAESDDDQALIKRILNHFNQQDYYYSLDAPLLGRDAVDDFMFTTRTGFCEHYASAFAVMMRMAGIPSRVVTGYQGGWQSEFGNYMLVRQSDAHAWVEVWLAGEGWTRVDPTSAVSPTRVQKGSLSALGQPRHMFDFDWVLSARNGFDVLEQRWNDWVIKFSAESQARMFSFLGWDYVTPAGLVTVLFGVLGILGLILAPFILRTVGPGSKDPVQQAWQKFLRRLKKTGFEYQASDGAMELAGAAAVQLPANSSEIYHIAHLYNQHRYAPEEPKLSEIQQAVRQFRPQKKAG